MVDRAAMDQWREDLLAVGFTLDGVADRLGPQAVAAIGRGSTVAASSVLEGADDPQADAIRLWMLQQPVPVARAARWARPALRAAGLVSGEEELRATVSLLPAGSDQRSGWVCSDQPALDGRSARPRPDFVLGASGASTTLAQLVPRSRVRTALDLGTGCGIQSLHLSAHCDRVVATDLNPRALELARIGLDLSGVDADLRLGSLYEPVAGERFDLIVSNPPYVMSPPGGNLMYRESPFAGDGLVREVIRSAPLTPGGVLAVLGNWAHSASGPWEERVADWVPPGCDALVLQRERLDPYEYIELWLADAGLAGTAGYLPAYRRWLDYFGSLGITGVGLGWVFVYRGERARPDVRIEEWAHPVAQPVGEAISRHFAALDPAGWDDASLLSARLRHADDVTQEAIGEPGASDPEHLVLRQSTGLCRAVAVDTALAAITGACDGDLPLGVLVDAVARLLDVDAATLRADLLPRVRSLIADGFLEVDAAP